MNMIAGDYGEVVVTRAGWNGNGPVEELWIQGGHGEGSWKFTSSKYTKNSASEADFETAMRLCEGLPFWHAYDTEHWLHNGHPGFVEE